MKKWLVVGVLLLLISGCVTRTSTSEKGAVTKETIWVWQKEFRQ